MAKKSSRDLSWIDDAVKQLNKEPVSALDKVSELIKQFNIKKIEDVDKEDIRKLVDFLTYFFLMLPYNISNPIEVWRVRPSKCGELFFHTEDLKYPPKKNVSPGRANSSISPIFYAGTSPETTFAECRLNEGDFFHLTKYVLNPSPKFNIHILGDIDSLRRRSKTVFELPMFDAAYKYALDALKPEIRLAVQIVDAFFVDRLSRKGNKEEYRITSAITSELLQSDALFGILYPKIGRASCRERVEDRV